MSSLAPVLLAAAAMLALADWVAVGRSTRWLEYATKPAVMVALILFAVALRPAGNAERAFFVFALTLGLVSDVLLMLPRDLFLAGLVAALVEHLAYIAGFRTRELHAGLLIAALVVALASTAVFLPPLYRSIRAVHPRLLYPVLAYAGVFVVMVTSAGGSGSFVALAGALLFFYSDAVLAWNRFVRPVPFGRLINIVPYHVGEAMLVLSLLT